MKNKLESINNIILSISNIYFSNSNLFEDLKGYYGNCLSLISIDKSAKEYSKPISIILHKFIGVHFIQSSDISTVIINRIKKKNKNMRLLVSDWLKMNNIPKINKNSLKKYKNINLLSDYSIIILLKVKPNQLNYQILVDHICNNIILCNDYSTIKTLLKDGYSNIWYIDGSQHNV